jgi:hypothetical protein
VNVTREPILEILNTIDVTVPACKEFVVVNMKVLEVLNGQHAVAVSTVRINDTVRNDFASDDWQQGWLNGCW